MLGNYSRNPSSHPAGIVLLMRCEVVVADADDGHSCGNGWCGDGDLG